ncbi:mitogen-activated protein kinase kinase kinase 20-like [Amphiura filiformis]|uniref:mitogen-activated protein kinase kinase kinase 20-like n=1 Tax=Amphiura filiformis TaxID=82378 RepID=UPI003B20BE42
MATSMSTSLPTNVPKIKKDELQLVKQIGSGGFGAVFQMKWKGPRGEIQVAAKRLNDPDSHEINILASLDHASIVKLLGFVDEAMEFMLILELCEGGSLRSYLDEHGGLSTNVVMFVDWAKQAAIPIKYLRGKQIVHKDVKSPNYLITRDNKLKLADFGLAKKIEHTISNATERASFPWMAPELFTLSMLSPNYDIFALAIVIWELWTGQFPFKGLQFQVIAWRVCQLKERLPIPADMPRPITDLLRQCWEEDWHKRPTIEHIISVITTDTYWLQQILAGSWVMTKQFGSDRSGQLSHYIQDIAVNPNGDIAIVDWSTKVKVFSSESAAWILHKDWNQGTTTNHY